MAADVTLDSEPLKSCCAEWKEKYLKLEGKRNALRQAVKLLETEVNKLQTENLELKRVCEQEKKRGDCESKEKEKEFHSRNELEKEMYTLKEEIASLRNKGCPEDQDDCRDDVLLSRVLEAEAEISRLNELFEKERKGFASERKKAETEKVKAAEARKLVEVEKKKVEEEKKRADIERKRAQECQLCLESLKLEANQMKSKLLAEKTKVDEAKRKAEVEKQKAVREKKRAESEKERVLEQKKCTEAERQKAITEKSHADHLSQQLEEERKKNEALKKEIEEVISTGGSKKRNHSLPTGNIRAIIFNEKVFKDKLKMEKEKTKHAKRMAKLEKVQNRLLLKELYLLKQSALQLSHRFDVLDKCFSRGIEGIDGLAKIGNSPKVERNKSNLRVPVVQGHDLHFQIENELTRTCCTRDALDHQGSSVECARTLFPNFGGGHTQPISGISSELESVIGGSVRNESQNSALYSTSTSFSDRQLIGSQGRRVLPTTASANPGEENLGQGQSVRTFSCEGTEKRYCKNLAVSGEKNIWSHLDKPLTTSSLGQTLTDGYEVQDKPSGHKKKKKRIQNASEAVAFDSRKRKKIHDAMESVTSFNSNDEKFVMGMKGTSLLNVLSPESDSHGPFCPHDGGNSECLPLDEKLSKSRRADLKQPSVLLRSGSGKLDPRDHLQFECRGDFVFPSLNQGSAAGHACRDKITSGRRDTLCFDEIASGDYTRLVQLDDPKDEERFRMAMKMPLSPTLPEIESPKRGDFEANNTDSLFENCINRESMIEEDKFVMACSNHLGFDEKHEVSMLGHGISTHNEDNSGVAGSSEIFVERGVIPPAKLGQDSICHGLASDSRSKVSLQVPIPKVQWLEVSCISMPKYFVMFSNVRDELKIFRIFSAAKNCISRCSVVSQTSSVVSMILHELALKNDLLSEEKVSAFFSMLLHIFSVTANSGRLKSGNYSFFSDFLKEQMNKEVKSLLLELCWCDLLFSLIEDFLIAGRVWVHNDVDGKALVPVDSGSEMSSHGRSLFMSKTATCHQLEAGGIILASVCLVFDCVDFICDASYSILRMCNGGSAWILTVLHGFASICGEEYLHHSKYGLVMTSIKSVVLFLERGIGAVGSESSCCRYPASDIQLPEFSPCAQCPFMEGALGLDKVTLLLMDKLEDHGIVVAGHQDVKELISSLPMVPAQPEGPGRMIQYRNNINGGSEVSHLLQNDTEAASEQVDGGTEPILHQLTDAISLMELLSQYLSCDWLYSIVIRRLLTLLDSQMHKEFSAAVLLLIGQLGRQIIDSGRCLQELEELRCNVYEFLDVAAERERGFPFQFAAVHALADLAAFDFEEFIQKNSQISVDTARSTGRAAAARKWFSQLSREQQDLALKYFQSHKARTDGGV